MVLTRNKRQALIDENETDRLEETFPLKKRKIGVERVTDPEKIAELKESLEFKELSPLNPLKPKKKLKQKGLGKYEKEAEILNHSFDKQLIKDIVQKSVRQLVKNFKQEEYETESEYETETDDTYEETENSEECILETTETENEDFEMIQEENKMIQEENNTKEIVGEQSPIQKTSSNKKRDIESITPYDKFLEYIDSIHSGTFFERIPLEEKERKLKKKISVDEITELNSLLGSMKKEYLKDAPSIIDILKSNKTIYEKKKLLEQVHSYVNSEMMSEEYHAFLNPLLKNKTRDPELQEIENKIIEASTVAGISDDYKLKILQSKMSFENKVIAYSKLQAMESHANSEETISQQMWLDNLLRVPFEKYSGNEIQKNSLSTIKSKLDEKLSFLENPKDQIINITAQMYKNKNASINAIGIFGPRGTGKTSIIASFANALNRPYRIIPLGGESDSSMLTGNLKTYIGSSPGRIVEILSETKCMNPIILFDELDKISDDVKGKEIISTLIHLTDHTTNSQFSGDKYFSGINFDLSKILFVFTYNDASKIDKILADRLYKIKVEDYKFKEKMEIAKNHITPAIFKEFALDNNNIEFEQEALDHLIRSTEEYPGMRTIKQKIQIIVSRINTLLVAEKADNIIKLPYNKLQDYYQTCEANGKIVILKQHISTLLLHSTTDEEKNKVPFMMYT